MVENIKSVILLMIPILASINEYRKAYILIENKNYKSRWKRNKIVISILLGSEFNGY